MSETTRRRVKTLKTVLAMRQPALFEKNKVLKIGQVVVILVRFELGRFFFDTLLSFDILTCAN